MKSIFSIFFFFLIAIKISAQIPAQTVPDFQFYLFNKTAFTTKDLSKNKILFFIFFDAECEHCRHAVSYIGEHYTAFKNTAVYLITMDSQEKANQFLIRYGIKLKDKKNVTILQDKDSQFINKFKPRKYPSMFLYSKEKTLIDYQDDEAFIFRFVNAVNKK